MTSSHYDTLIIGGGPAGMSAALYLGRSRKRVAVIDASAPRHAPSPAVHNLISRDGISPHALREETWIQMKAYPSVTQLSDTKVVTLEHDGEQWHATTSEGDTHVAPTVLLATGVIDEHPDIPGYEAFWAHTIHHCPYCHGWEMRDMPLAVLGHGDYLRHMLPLLRNWSKDIEVLTHGDELDEETLAFLHALDLPIHTSPIASLTGTGTNLQAIHFETGDMIERTGLFVEGIQRPVPLVAQLDLEMEGAYVKVDAFQNTSAPNLWAAGDLCTRFQQVVLAASQGAMAAVTINASLIH